MSEAQTALAREKYINLETFKRDGTGVLTPIWFAPEGEGWVFFTNGTSWKVKRLARNDRVRFAACGYSGKVRGPWFEGRSWVLDEVTEIARARDALTAKYGLSVRVTRFFSRLVGGANRAKYFRITPATPEE